MPPVRAYLPWTSHFSFDTEDPEDQPEDTTDDAETSFLYIPYANRVTNATRSTSAGYWPNNVLTDQDHRTQQSDDAETHFACIEYTNAEDKAVILKTAISSLRRYSFTIYPSRVHLSPWNGIIIKVQIERDLGIQGIWSAVQDAAIGRLSSLLRTV